MGLPQACAAVLYRDKPIGMYQLAQAVSAELLHRSRHGPGEGLVMADFVEKLAGAAGSAY
jgi:hypothetical protein